MPSPRDMLERLLSRGDLGEEDASALLRHLADAETAPAAAGALLAAMRAKGVTAAELRGFAAAMRELARRPNLPMGGPMLDIAGTGGDGSGSLNLSTGAALLAAACGARVVKHGNRAVSSRAGSADFIEALGLVLPLDENAAGDCLRATGFTFLFAPHYHPAMKAIAPVRAALGVRTIFNVLGPLTNPASPKFQLLGAFDAATAKLMAETLSGMAIERAFVVHGAHGWDEPAPTGPFMLFDVRPGSVRLVTRQPEDFGIRICAPEQLAGGDATHNARALRRAFRGEDRGAHRDALLLGAALALELTGDAANPREGVTRAAEAIDGGKAQAVLDGLAAFQRGRVPA